MSQQTIIIDDYNARCGEIMTSFKQMTTTIDQIAKRQLILISALSNNYIVEDDIMKEGAGVHQHVHGAVQEHVGAHGGGLLGCTRSSRSRRR